MHVEKMISYDEAEQIENSGKYSIGCCGGWFGFLKPMRWEDYLKIWKPEAHIYCEAFREYVLQNRLKRGGDWHQETEGAPLFSDGTAATFSYRAWGDILAAIWSEEENKDYSYMDFYMDMYLRK